MLMPILLSSPREARRVCVGVVVDVEGALTRGRQREAVAGADVLDRDDEVIALAVPEQRDVDAFVVAVCQLGHLRPPVVVDRASAARHPATIAPAGVSRCG